MKNELLQTKTQVHLLMQVMDEDVYVKQLMDDLFLPPDAKDLDVEFTIMNASLEIHGVNNANMVQQIYSTMDDFAIMLVSMPRHQDSLGDDEVEADMP